MSFSPKKLNAEIIDKVVAQVGSQIITLHDVEKFAPSIVRSINTMPEGDERNNAWQAYYDEAIEFVIYDKTLEIAAARVGITATDREIQEMIGVLQEQNTQFRERVRAILDREGTVTPELYLFVKQIILRNKLSGILIPRAIVTEDDLKNYIRQNTPDTQYEQLEYDIDIVFLADGTQYNQFKGNVRRMGLEGAAEAVDASVIKMGWVRMEHLVENMQKELEYLREGSISDGIRDESGRYIVMRLNDTRSVSAVTEQERNAITYNLREEQLNTIFTNWLERQKKSIIVNRYK